MIVWQYLVLQIYCSAIIQKKLHSFFVSLLCGNIKSRGSSLKKIETAVSKHRAFWKSYMPMYPLKLHCHNKISTPPCKSTAAPFFKRSSATSVCPLCVAIRRGDHPSCAKKKKINSTFVWRTGRGNHTNGTHARGRRRKERNEEKVHDSVQCCRAAKGGFLLLAFPHVICTSVWKSTAAPLLKRRSTTSLCPFSAAM